MYIFHYRRLNSESKTEWVEKRVSFKNMLFKVEQFLKQKHWTVLRIFKNEKTLCVSHYFSKDGRHEGGRFDCLALENVGHYKVLNDLFIESVKLGEMRFVDVGIKPETLKVK